MRKELEVGRKKYQKMWETSNAWVYDIYTGTLLPTLRSLPRVLPFADRNCFFYFENGIGGFYYEETEMREAAKAGLALLDPVVARNFFGGIGSDMAELRSFSACVKDSDISRMGDEEIRKLLEISLSSIVHIFGYYIATNPQYVAGLEERARVLLEDSVPDEDVREAFTVLSIPHEESTLRREEIEWNRIVLSLKQNSAARGGLLKKHLDTFGLVPFGDGGKAWTMKDLEERLARDLEKNMAEIGDAISKLERALEEVKEEQEAVAAKFKVSRDALTVLALLGRLAHVRLEMRVSGWMPAFYYSEVVLLNEAARRFGYPEEKIRFLTPDEIFSIFDGKQIDRSILKERETAFCARIHEGVLTLYSGEDAKRLFSTLVSKSDSSERSVRGMVAQRGKVRGRAVVFRWGDDVKKKLEEMQNDSILIAGQTRPQLMPLIHASAAIVTDEGGITSHAAIVSRELRKPCIIGTKSATAMIKSGDLVEVDAETGVVTIL